MGAIDHIPATPDLELDAFIESFESAVARGMSPSISDFLPVDHPKHSSVLRELIRLDLEFAWDRGESPRIDEYLSRFPALADDALALADIAREEWRQRISAGERPNPREYERRFGLDFSDELSRTLAVEVGSAWSGERMPETGDVITPGFVVRSEIGRGAFGRVYLAEQADLAGRLVAIKVSSRLIGEAQTLARLQHSNIVPIYSVHRVGEFQILVMPYLGSATLADLMKSIRGSGVMPTTGKAILTAISAKSGNVLPPSAPSKDSEGNVAEFAARENELPGVLALAKLDYVKAILGIGVALADGLAHAHSRGILHRDLKPANVLIADDGRPMLLDFNLAADERGQAEIEGGTPRYMAPEHLASLAGESVKIDGRADLYSLGLLLHELLTGEFPFPDRTGIWNQVVQENRRDRIQQPTIRVESPAIAAIVGKCLQPDLARRYASSDDLREDLALHLENQPLRFAHEPFSVERFRKWSKRHPRLTSGTTVGGLALIILLALGSFTYMSRRDVGVHRAREARAHLIQTRDEVQSLVVDPHGPPSQLQQARSRSQAALQAYDGAGDRWLETRPVRNLPSEEIDALREAVAELLYYQAEATGRLAERAVDRTSQSDLLNEAIHLNERAGAAYPGDGRIRPIVAQRIWLLRAAGKNIEANEASRDLSGLQISGPTEFPEAIALMREGLYREASQRLEALGSRGKRSFSVWMALGTCRLRTGQGDLAADAFLAAAVLSPENPWPAYYRGVAFLAANRLEAARLEFDRFLTVEPGEADGWLNRAIVRFRQKDYAGVLDDVSHAEKLDGSPTRVHSLREQVATAKGNFEKANREHARLLAAKPRGVEDWTIRGESRLAQSKVDAKTALSDFDQALVHAPEHLPALRGKASCLSEHLNRPREAMEVLELLMRVQPDNLEDRGGFAVLLAREGRIADARAQARKCVMPNASSFVLYQAASALALIAHTPAEKAEAIELIRRVLRQEPTWGTQMPADQDLKSIHSDKSFQEIVAAARVLEVRTKN